MDGPPKQRVEEIADLVEAQLPEDVVLVGHSLGGAVSIEIALRRPLAGLVLLNTGGRLRVWQQLLSWMEAAAQSGEVARVSASACQGGTDPALIGLLEKVESEVPPLTALADWRASNHFDRLADIGRISVPTLVCGGDADLLTPVKYAQALHDRIAGSHLHIFRGGGHMLPLEQPAWVIDRIGEMFGKG